MNDTEERHKELIDRLRQTIEEFDWENSEHEDLINSEAYGTLREDLRRVSPEDFANFEDDSYWIYPKTKVTNRRNN